MSSAPRRRTRPAEDDRGSITVIMLGLILALVAVFGLVFDAGGALTDRQRAADLAEQAARAGADVLLPGTGATTDPRIDPGGGEAAALAYLAAAGPGATGQAGATATTVTVRVTLRHPTQLLSLIGISSLTLTGAATAHALPGLQTQAAGG